MPPLLVRIRAAHPLSSPERPGHVGSWSPKKRIWLAALVGIIAAFAALSSLYSQATPLGQAPDELAHLNYVKLIAQHFQLPVDAPERQQPPLYYLLAALIYKLTENPQAVRALSIALGIGTLITIAMAARLVWPTRPHLWPFAAGVVAANPQFQFNSGSVTDDSLANLVAAVLTVLTLRVILTAPSRRLYAGVGVGVGLGLLSKETDYFLVLLLLVTAGLMWIRRSHPGGLVLVVVIPLVMAGWWFLRNAFVYQHLLPTFQPLDNPTAPKLRQFSQLHDWYAVTFQSSFALFGNMTTMISVAGHDIAVYRALEVAVGTGVVLGLLVAALNWRRWEWRQRLAALSLLTIPVIAAGQAVLNSIFVDYQPQGRYLFVAAPAVALMVTFAVFHATSRLVPIARTALLVAAISAAAVLDLSGVYTVQHSLLLN